MTSRRWPSARPAELRVGIPLVDRLRFLLRLLALRLLAPGLFPLHLFALGRRLAAFGSRLLPLLQSHLNLIALRRLFLSGRRIILHLRRLPRLALLVDLA